MLRPAVDIYASEPLRDADFLHAGDLPNFFPIRLRHGKGEGNFVARYQAQGLGGVGLAEIESMIDGHQDAQEAERHAHTQDGEQRAPPVAPTVLQYQWQVSKHAFTLLLSLRRTRPKNIISRTRVGMAMELSFTGPHLISCDGEASFGPAAPTAIHGDHFGVAHLLKIVGGEGGAEAAAAIQHHGRRAVGDALLDITLDDALPEVNGPGQVTACRSEE